MYKATAQERYHGQRTRMRGQRGQNVRQETYRSISVTDKTTIQVSSVQCEDLEFLSRGRIINISLLISSLVQCKFCHWPGLLVECGINIKDIAAHVGYRLDHAMQCFQMFRE